MEKELGKIEYEKIKDAIHDGRVENNGIWLSWSDLWRIDAVAVRNASKAIENEPDGIKQLLFQNFVGQRMLIEELADIVRLKKENEE